MLNFVVQILISIFIGGCFVFLAKRYQKNQTTYFSLGFFICFSVRFIYLIIFGFISDFKINTEYTYHRNLSVLLSVIISYIAFIIIRKKLHKLSPEKPDINKIGKE